MQEVFAELLPESWKYNPLWGGGSCNLGSRKLLENSALKTLTLLLIGNSLQTGNSICGTGIWG